MKSETDAITIYQLMWNRRQYLLSISFGIVLSRIPEIYHWFCYTKKRMRYMITFKAEFDKPEGVQGIKGVWSAKCRRDFLEVFCIIRVYLLLQENFVSKMLFERCIVYPLFVV